MSSSKRFWFLRSWPAWTVLVLGAVTAAVTREPWIVTLGIIGFLLVLLLEAGLDPRSLVYMVSAEQENRSLRAEHSRLVGGIRELNAQVASLEGENQRLTRELGEVRTELEQLRARQRQRKLLATHRGADKDKPDSDSGPPVTMR